MVAVLALVSELSLAMPRLSWSRERKLAYGVSLALPAGRKTSLPAARSAALTVLGRSGPVRGSEERRGGKVSGRRVTMTADRPLAGLSLRSVKLKSGPAKT